MKKQLIGLCLLCIASINLYSQDVRIKAIPYVLHFENKVADYKVLGDNQIQISAPANTDLFISPDGNFRTNKSPRLLFRPDSDFILTAKISLKFKAKWDAGVIILYNDEQHFAKFCFESDFKGQPRIVSVVCNDAADDCNAMPITTNNVYYRVIGSTKTKAFNFYYSADGKSWYPIRAFKLDKVDNLAIGFSAQSPSGKGAVVDFSAINLQERKPINSWLGE